MPLPRNPFFTGRAAFFTDLEAALGEGKVVALTGLGGIGKTQIAAEYAYRHRGDYNAILWVSAESQETLITGLATLAERLGLPERDAAERAQAVAAVYRWLTAHPDWLLILDNADDLELIHDLVSADVKGHRLLTTRDPATGPLIQSFPVKEMMLEEGVLFLLRRAKLIAPDTTLDRISAVEKRSAQALVEMLGGLPLALDQASAYIERMQISLDEYQNLYQQEGKWLREQRGKHAIDHPSVAATFSLAFKKVTDASPAAAELLYVCAWLHPERIPEEIFIAGAAELGAVLEPVMSTRLGLVELRRVLSQLSLIQRDPAHKVLMIHRVVQKVLQDEMDASTQRQWAECVVRTVNQTFPAVEFATWSSCERLLTQAQVCAEHIQTWGFEFEEAARLLNDTGIYLYERARYAEAEPLYQRALHIREKALGAEHPHVAQSLNNLAELYRVQGQYAQAEPLYQRALHIWEKALGAEHPHVATSLNNLAELYRAQGQYAQAEPLYQRALHIREKALGAEHPHVATSLNNLALLYHKQGQYAQAEPLYQRALHIAEKALGAEHPDVATIRENLAGFYEDQGQDTKAKPLYRRIVTVLKKILGKS